VVSTLSPEWQLIPREADLSRVYDPLSKWHRLALVERYNTPDSWTITGPPETMSVFAPGSGCILDRNGEQVTSGKVINIARSASRVDNRIRQTMTVTFASDLAPIGRRIIFPSPSTNLTTTVSQFPAAYDLRTGPIETVALGYIRSHLGDLAQVDRRYARLRLPASLGRGGTTQVSGRLDNIGTLIRDMFEVGGLRVRIISTEDGAGGWLDLVITAVEDKSNDIRFGSAESAATGIISEWSYEIGMPTVTRAIVAGGNTVEDNPATRDFLQVDDLAQEALWGEAIEVLIDQRQVDPASTDKQQELSRAANEALAEGAGPVRVAFTPVLGPDLEYRRDVQVGDIVGYDLPGLEPAEDKIREATTVVSVEDGQPTEKVTVVVGTPDAPSNRNQQQAARALRDINIIKRSQ
jgi:hypothetical protein